MKVTAAIHPSSTSIATDIGINLMVMVHYLPEWWCGVVYPIRRMVFGGGVTYDCCDDSRFASVLYSPPNSKSDPVVLVVLAGAKYLRLNHAGQLFRKNTKSLQYRSDMQCGMDWRSLGRGSIYRKLALLRGWPYSY